MSESDPQIQLPRVAPLFPLPDFILFPGAAHFLQIFEPRYVQMVKDQLDTAGYIVMGTVFDEHREDLSGAPPVPDVAGLGQIIEYRELPDGLYLILLHGQARVQIQEIESDRRYRQVEFQVIEEPEPNERERIEHEGLKETLLNELAEKNSNSDVDLDFTTGASLAQLVDLLLMQLSLAAEDLYPIFAQRSLVKRAKIALSHA